MSPPFGVNLGVWICMMTIGIAVAIALIGGLWKLDNWKGGLDQWKKGVDDWKNDVKIILKDLQADVAVIKSASEKDAMRNGMLQRHSPLVPSKKAKSKTLKTGLSR